MKSMPGSGSGLARVAIGALMLSMSATEALAQHHDGLVDVRVWGGAAGRYVLTDNGTFPEAGFGTVALKIEDSKPTFGGDIEFRVHRWLGIDVGGAYTRFTVNGTSSLSPTLAQDRLRVMPVFASLNVHLVSTNVVDIWVGPQIGYFFYGGELSFPFAGVGTLKVLSGGHVFGQGIQPRGGYWPRKERGLEPRVPLAERRRGLERPPHD